ncbi:MAG TPA: DNA-directed RNA polymerase subunit omega [Mariniphaga sp.]|nr:DNA-directed RNA polymerase subunit omega [Mariniphaga sp.]
MNIEPIELREIDKNAANVYEAVIVAAKRARQINDEQKMEYNALLSTLVPQTTTEEEGEDIQNPAQLKMVLELESREKPHIKAINELLEGKIEFDYKK